jgi:hypothetical protein
MPMYHPDHESIVFHQEHTFSLFTELESRVYGLTKHAEIKQIVGLQTPQSRGARRTDFLVYRQNTHAIQIRTSSYPLYSVNLTLQSPIGSYNEPTLSHVVQKLAHTFTSVHKKNIPLGVTLETNSLEIPDTLIARADTMYAFGKEEINRCLEQVLIKMAESEQLVDTWREWLAHPTYRLFGEEKPLFP